MRWPSSAQEGTYAFRFHIPCVRSGIPAARAAAPKAPLGRCRSRLGHGIAQAADHEGRRVGLTRMGARDKGVQMRSILCTNPCGGQKIERAIGHRRLRAEILPRAADRGSRRRQARGAPAAGTPGPCGVLGSGVDPLVFAARFGCFKRVFDARRMIVLFKTDRVRCSSAGMFRISTCYVISYQIFRSKCYKITWRIPMSRILLLLLR